MLKTYQFKTHCKGDSHSSKTVNIILPGLMIKQRWTTLRLQAKWYSDSLNCALCWLKQLISPKLNSLSLLYFACRHKLQEHYVLENIINNNKTQPPIGGDNLAEYHWIHKSETKEQSLRFMSAVHYTTTDWYIITSPQEPPNSQSAKSTTNEWMGRNREWISQESDYFALAHVLR